MRHILSYRPSPVHTLPIEEEVNPILDLTCLLTTGRASDSLTDFLGSGEQMSERVCYYPDETASIDNLHRVFKNGSPLSPTLL